MKHATILFEKLNIPSDIIEAIGAETLPDDFDSKVQSYNQSRIDYFKATPEFKTLVKESQDSTYKGALLKHNKRINEALGLGLTNAQLEEIKSIEDFAELTKGHLTEREKKLMSSSDATLKADLDKYKTEYTTMKSEYDKLQGTVEQVRAQAMQEKDEAIDLYKAQILFEQIKSSDKELPGVDGQDFTLQLIRDRIFSDYIVKGDGKILAKDGTAAVHPERQTIMTDLKEIYEYSKIKAGLIKKSNAGAGAGSGSGSSGGALDPSIAAKMQELRNARQK